MNAISSGVENSCTEPDGKAINSDGADDLEKNGQFCFGICFFCLPVDVHLTRPRVWCGWKEGPGLIAEPGKKGFCITGIKGRPTDLVVVLIDLVKLKSVLTEQLLGITKGEVAVLVGVLQD